MFNARTKELISHILLARWVVPDVQHHPTRRTRGCEKMRTAISNPLLALPIHIQFRIGCSPPARVGGNRAVPPRERARESLLVCLSLCIFIIAKVQTLKTNPRVAQSPSAAELSLFPSCLLHNWCQPIEDEREDWWCILLPNIYKKVASSINSGGVWGSRVVRFVIVTMMGWTTARSVCSNSLCVGAERVQRGGCRVTYRVLWFVEYGLPDEILSVLTSVRSFVIEVWHLFKNNHTFHGWIDCVVNGFRIVRRLIRRLVLKTYQRKFVILK